MRRVVVNIETTGVDPDEEHRIVELAAVELNGGRRSVRSLHTYINPMRLIEPYAAAIHGVTDEFLTDAPTFADIAEEFVSFIRGAEFVAHNAEFPLGFINSELERLGHEPIEVLCSGVTDTLQLARSIRLNLKNDLDTLCKDLRIKPSRPGLMGAALDADLLATIYLKFLHRHLH